MECIHSFTDKIVKKSDSTIQVIFLCSIEKLIWGSGRNFDELTN